jgi:hypothetical protein
MDVAIGVSGAATYRDVVREGKTSMLRMRSDRDLESFEWLSSTLTDLALTSFPVSKPRVLCQALTSAPHILSCLPELLHQRNSRAGRGCCVSTGTAFFLAFGNVLAFTALGKNLLPRRPVTHNHTFSPTPNNTSLYSILQHTINYSLLATTHFTHQ